jgi:hypothetical protein
MLGLEVLGLGRILNQLVSLVSLGARFSGIDLKHDNQLRYLESRVPYRLCRSKRYMVEKTDKREDINC